MQGHRIKNVDKGSPAYAAGIQPGWHLMLIDENYISDIIDYKVLTSDEELILLVRDEKGTDREVTVEKDYRTDLGLSFQSPSIDNVQRCCNKCIFCFVDQNPPGMRSSLYLKDDDYRLSFLHGNFISLNRINPGELKRIIKYQLSPLYVSVHTTNPQLRKKLFQSRSAIRGLDNLQKLIDNNIRIHAQIVICPGYNDGEELERTLSDLAKLGNNIDSIALVPVGLTNHRSSLQALYPVDRLHSELLVENVQKWQKRFISERGNRFVYLADEIYQLAGIDFPHEIEYDGYPQLENGVGMARLFLDEIKEAQKGKAKFPDKKLKVSLITGTLAKPFIDKMVGDFKKSFPFDLQVIAAKNSFYGSSVQVSGLLTGKDIIKATANVNLGEIIYLPENMILKQDKAFLDDLTVDVLEEKLGVPIDIASGPLDLINKIKALSKDDEGV